MLLYVKLYCNIVISGSPEFQEVVLIIGIKSCAVKIVYFLPRKHKESMDLVVWFNTINTEKRVLLIYKENYKTSMASASTN